jgi:hypothetical protein
VTSLAPSPSMTKWVQLSGGCNFLPTGICLVIGYGFSCSMHRGHEDIFLSSCFCCCWATVLAVSTVNMKKYVFGLVVWWRYLTVRYLTVRIIHKKKCLFCVVAGQQILTVHIVQNKTYAVVCAGKNNPLSLYSTPSCCTKIDGFILAATFLCRYFTESQRMKTEKYKPLRWEEYRQ